MYWKTVTNEHYDAVTVRVWDDEDRVQVTAGTAVSLTGIAFSPAKARSLARELRKAAKLAEENAEAE